MEQIRVTGRMPVLALRGMTVFPEQTVHFDIGRIKSALALENAMKADQILYLAPQKNLMDEDPKLSGLHGIGTVVQVKQILKAQNENIRVLVTGLYRAKITNLTQAEPFLAGTVEEVLPYNDAENIRSRALRREANNLYGVYLDLCERPSQSLQMKMMASDDCGFIADAIAQNSGIDHTDKARLLAQLHPVRRLEMAVQLLRQEVQMPARQPTLEI